MKIYNKWWFWVLVFLTFIAILGFIEVAMVSKLVNNAQAANNNNSVDVTNS